MPNSSGSTTKNGLKKIKQDGAKTILLVLRSLFRVLAADQAGHA